MATKSTSAKQRSTAKTQSKPQNASSMPVEKETAEAVYNPVTLDPSTVVTVRNGFQGQLIYKSRKTGEVWRWDAFGEEQDMELSELRNAKSSAKAFFENNWFMIDDPAVIEYLGVRQYYKHTVSVDDFESLFEMSPAELEKVLTNMPQGQKTSVAYRARELVAQNGIDSMKTIAVLEKCLGIELVAR